MSFVRPLVVAAVTTLALGVAAAPAGATAPGKPGAEPCAQQAKQVTQAQDALAHVTAVFAHQQTKVERLQAALAAATTAEEQARIQARLDRALAKEQHTKKEKKAQQKRLEKAMQRLIDCQAAQQPS